MIAANREWRKNNPEKAALVRNRRRARKKSVISSLEFNQWMLVLDLCNYRCLACGSDIDIQCDHIVPLSPGTHTIDNVQPLCPTCNRTKNRTAIDYRPKSVRELVSWEMLELGLC